MTEEEKIIEEKLSEFKKLTLPVVQYIADNFHPHAKVIIDNNSVELVEGITAFTTDTVGK